MLYWTITYRLTKENNGYLHIVVTDSMGNRSVKKILNEGNVSGEYPIYSVEVNGITSEGNKVDANTPSSKKIITVALDDVTKYTEIKYKKCNIGTSTKDVKKLYEGLCISEEMVMPLTNLILGDEEGEEIGSYIYVFKVVNKWGNAGYKYVTLTVLDKEAPEYEKDFEVSVSEGRLLKEEKDQGQVVGYVVVEKEAGLGNSFLYRGETVKLNFPAKAVKDNVLGGYSNQKIYVEICYKEECKNVAISLDKDGYTNESAVELNQLFGVEEIEGIVTYRIKDEARNSNDEVRSFTIRKKDNVTVEIETTTDEIVNEYVKEFKVKYESTKDSLLLEKVEYYFDDDTTGEKEELCISEIGEGEELENIACGGVLDSQYILKYKITDKLGNEREEVAIGNDGSSLIKIDTIKPVNKKLDRNEKEIIKYSLRKDDNGNYMLVYDVMNEEEIEEGNKLEIRYSDGTAYCSGLIVNHKECGIIESAKLSGEQVGFKTRQIDKAGNISEEELEYVLGYNNSRGISVSQGYDGVNKNITITITALNPSGEVKKVEVYVDGVKSDILTGAVRKGVNNNYSLVIETPKEGNETFVSFFNNGFIDKKIEIKVFDEYQVNEGYEELGQMGESKEITLKYDTNNPDITIGGRSMMNTLKEDIIFTYGISNKGIEGTASIKEINYIIRRTSNVSSLPTIDKTNFESVSCPTCVRGLNKVEGENKLRLEKQDLASGLYELIVYVKDEYGNAAIKSMNLSIDNTAPKITITNFETGQMINGIERDGGYLAYSKTIKVSVSDTENYYYSGIGTTGFVLVKEGGGTYYPVDKYGYDISIGGMGTYDDGYYEIIVEDNAGNISRQKVIVDAEHSGFQFYKSNGSVVNTDEEVFNKATLKELEMAIHENIGMLRMEFRYGNAKVLWYEIKGNSCKYSLNEVKDCPKGWEEIFKVKDGDRISLRHVINLVAVENTTINQLYIRADNMSGIKMEETIELDYAKPEIEIKTSYGYTKAISENAKEVIGESCNTDKNCRNYVANVMTSGEASAYRTAIKKIVTGYIIRLDGKVYSASIEENYRMAISYYRTDKLDEVVTLEARQNKEDTDQWEIFENILREVGTYIIEYRYEDRAGNKAEPLYLEIKVIDDVAPEVINVNSINKTGNYLYIQDEKGIKYTVQGIKGKDNYGFDAKGNVKEKDFYEGAFELKIRNGETGKYESVSYREVSKGLYNIMYGTKVYGSKSVVEGIVTYTFTKPAKYQIEYSVFDYAGNVPANAFIVALEVVDKDAPSIENDNEIEVVEDKIVIDGETYWIVDKFTEVVLEDNEGKEIAKIENNKFELNGKRYEINEGEGKLYLIIDINEGKICFEGEGCLSRVEAKDDQDDDPNTRVDIGKVEYSAKGDTYTPAKEERDYIINKTGTEVLFSYIKEVTFTQIGYYKIIFTSKDSKGNVMNEEYIIMVEDLEAPNFVLKTNGEVINEGYEEEIEYDKTFAEAIKKLSGGSEEEKIESYIKKWVNANVEITHNYIKGENYVYTIYEVNVLEVKEANEYLRYEVKLIAEDNSGNVRKMVLEYVVKDTVAPENGKIEISYDGIRVEDEEEYTNADNIYFRFKEGKDVTNQYKYKYRIEIDGEDTYGWQESEGIDFIKGYQAGSETRTIKIIYKVVDRVGLESQEKSITIIVDREAPVISATYKDNDGKTDLAILNGAQIKTDKEVTVKISGDNAVRELETVEIYRNNRKLSWDLSYNAMGVRGFGHYKVIAVDKANNRTEYEFIIMPETNTFTVVDNTSLNDVGNAASENKKFDIVILQKISSNGNSFYFGDMGIVADNDSVYLMGVVPNKGGALFSIYASGALEGKLFKQYENGQFPINISTNIKNRDPNYKLDDYVINYMGDKYIIVGIEKGTYVAPGEENEEVKKENEKEQSSIDFTWALYALGGIGAIGGIFLIMKLRRRIRAA